MKNVMILLLFLFGYCDAQIISPKDIDPPVPVEFMDMNLSIDNGVKLSWSTASELNNSHFTIKRSINGLDWVEIGTVIGHGTSKNENYYDWIDSNTENIIGDVYYKLIQSDYDGKSEELAIRFCSLDTIYGIKIVGKILNSYEINDGSTAKMHVIITDKKTYKIINGF